MIQRIQWKIEIWNFYAKRFKQSTTWLWLQGMQNDIELMICMMCIWSAWCWIIAALFSIMLMVFTDDWFYWLLIDCMTLHADDMYFAWVIHTLLYVIKDKINSFYIWLGDRE